MILKEIPLKKLKKYGALLRKRELKNKERKEFRDLKRKLFSLNQDIKKLGNSSLFPNIGELKKENFIDTVYYGNRKLEILEVLPLKEGKELVKFKGNNFTNSFIRKKGENKRDSYLKYNKDGIISLNNYCGDKEFRVII